MVRRVVAVLGFLVAAGSARAGSFVTFETGQVRPLALSPDDLHLYAVNTPDDRLEIFDIDAQGNLTHSGSVPVGLSRSRPRPTATGCTSGSSTTSRTA